MRDVYCAASSFHVGHSGHVLDGSSDLPIQSQSSARKPLLVLSLFGRRVFAVAENSRWSLRSLGPIEGFVTTGQNTWHRERDPQTDV